MRTSGFVSKAACRGYRPSRFAPHKGKLRPHLIARLAKERAIARFIVAPAGYGKTSLAVDYAETMFSWAHVFWLNAKSPCFIRDLDEGVVASACFEVDPSAKLVVVDDVPQLDSQRLQRLSREIDTLLAHGCEVIVICVPSCDLLGGLQIDRMRLGAADLLLTDEEVDAARSDEDRMREAAADVPAARRVPALAWDPSPESAARFMAGNLSEDLPSDLVLATISAYVLQQGAVSDLAGLGPIDLILADETFGDYPHMGFDADAGRFEAPLLDMEVIARAVKGKLDGLIARSPFATRDDLVRAWADALMARGYSADRACDAVRYLAQMKSRTAWLAAHARDLVRCGCFLATHRLVGSLKSVRCESRERILALDALCCRMLGDEDGAVRNAKRCAFEAVSPDDARVIGLLVLARHAGGHLRESAQGALAAWADEVRGRGGGPLAWHDALAVAWDARQEGVDKLARTWAELRQAHVDDDALCLAASWLFDLAGQAWGEGSSFDGSQVEAVERYVRARLTEGEAVPLDFFVTSAGLSMESAHVKGMVYAEGPLEAAVLLGLRRVEMAMLMQRRAFERSQREEQARRLEAMPEGPLYVGARMGQPPVEQRAVPLLELKLVGRLDMVIGGAPVDPRKIGRRQARVLLLALAANRGRDLSRDATAKAMWPNRGLQSARKNFYTTWSQLRHALMLPDGTCPYLVKHQYGCRLDERYVRSDLARLDDICRQLLFGPVDFDEWYEVYTEIDRDFAGDLLPIEENSGLVDKIRGEYRSRLIDALVTATLRLIEAGNPQRGIWFAREAVKRENVREDAHVALMRAQIAYGQRTAAMMTYLTCRRILAEELGIDPSPETTALYESLLGGS